MASDPTFPELLNMDFRSAVIGSVISQAERLRANVADFPEDYPHRHTDASRMLGMAERLEKFAAKLRDLELPGGAADGE